MSGRESQDRFEGLGTLAWCCWVQVSVFSNWYIRRFRAEGSAPTVDCRTLGFGLLLAPLGGHRHSLGVPNRGWGIAFRL